MLFDPFADETLVVYLKLSDTYADAVKEMCNLAGTNRRREFAAVAAQVRELAVQVEEARLAMMRRRYNGSANREAESQVHGGNSRTTGAPQIQRTTG